MDAPTDARADGGGTRESEMGEHLLEAVLRQMPAGVVLAAAPSGRILLVNERAKRICGDPFAQSSGVEQDPAFLNLRGLHPDGRAYDAAEWPLSRALSYGEMVEDEEITLLREDGARVTISTSAAPIRDPSGAIIAAVTTSQDMADLKQTQERLRATEAKLLGLFHSDVIGMAIGEGELTTDANDALLRMLGCTRDDLPLNWKELTPPEYQARSARAVEEAIETGKFAPFEKEFMHKDGSRIPTIIGGYTLGTSPFRYISFVLDISMRKRAEAERERLMEQLEDERARLRAVLQQMPVGIVIAEAPSGRVLLHNEEATALLRHPISHTTGIESYMQYGAVHADRRPYLPEEYPIARSTRFDAIIDAEEIRYRRGDGAMIDLSVSAVPVRNQAGQVIAGVSTFTDITETKEAERAREGMLAAVSHELKTPLTAIRAGLGLLEGSARDRLRPEERDLLENARRNTERLRLLVNDLLIFNQLHAEALHLEPTPFDVRDVVSSAVQAVTSLVQAKGQTLEMDVPAALPIRGDPRRLEHAIVNLLSNAHRHTPPGTRITVSGARMDGKVLLSVRDNGPGIPAEELADISRRFERPSVGDGSSGLGLAIAKGIIELHGGRIWVESAPGEGAVFSVALINQGDGG